MGHSKAFERARKDLKKRESEVRKDLEADSRQVFQWGAGIVAILGIAFFSLIFGRLFGGRKRRVKPARRSRNYRWVGRLLEFLIPFLITSYLNSQKKPKKEISDS